MIAISIAAAVFVVWLQWRMKANRGGWTRDAAVYIVLISIAYAALPRIDKVPADFFATLLWNFRLASLGIQAIIWTTLELLFGAFAERELERSSVRRMAAA